MYLLFAYDRYYPGGGWGDFQGSFPSLEEAMKSGAECNNEFWEVIWTDTLEIVADGTNKVKWDKDSVSTVMRYD